MASKIVYRTKYTPGPKGRANRRALKGIIIQNVANGIVQGLADDMFPDMEADMRKLIKTWEKVGMVDTDKDSVYDSFWYSKSSKMTTRSKTISFKNTSTHINPLIDGVTSKTGPWYVGDWVKNMASAGKLKSPHIKKNSKGKWPIYVTGIGDTTYKKSSALTNRIAKSKKKLASLELSNKRFKGKTREIKRLKRLVGGSKGGEKSTGLLDKKLSKSAGPKMFQTLIKGKSQRDFWNPVLKAYFGTQYQSGQNTKVNVNGDIVKYISQGINKKLRNSISIKNQLKKQTSEAKKNVKKSNDLAAGHSRFMPSNNVYTDVNVAQYSAKKAHAEANKIIKNNAKKKVKK